MAVLAVSAAQEKVVGNVWARAVFCVRRGGGRRRLRRLWLPVGHEQVSARFAVQWRMRQRRSEVEASTDAAGTGGSLRVHVVAVARVHAMNGVLARRGRRLVWGVQRGKRSGKGTGVLSDARVSYWTWWLRLGRREG